MPSSNSKVLTAPLAIIKSMDDQGNLVTIGKMKNIRVTESFRRIDVKGIGQFYPVERPAIDWQGSLSCSSYVIDLERAGFRGSPNRNTNDAEKFANTLLLNEMGISVYLYKKAKNVVNPTTGIIESVLEEPIAKIRECFIERQTFDVSEGTVAGSDQEFSYLKPILLTD